MKEESELKKEFQKIMKQHYFLKSDPELPYDNILSCMEDAYNLDRPTPAVETKTAEEITDNAFNQFWNKIMDSVCNHLNLSDDEALSLRCHVSEIEHDEFADQILNLFTPSAKSVEVEEDGFIDYVKSERQAITNELWADWLDRLPMKRVAVENLLIAYDQMVDKLEGQQKQADTISRMREALEENDNLKVEIERLKNALDSRKAIS